MTIVTTESWWTLMLRGAVAVLFGLLTFLWPGITLAALVLLFGAYAFADGVFNLVAAFRKPNGEKPRWVALVLGLVGVGAGLITILVPLATGIALLSLIAVWALVTGALQIVAAIRLRKQVTGEWLLVLSGLLSIAFGVILIVFPLAGALAIALWIGAYALVFGGLLIALGFKLRRVERDLHTAIPHPA